VNARKATSISECKVCHSWCSRVAAQTNLATFTSYVLRQIFDKNVIIITIEQYSSREAENAFTSLQSEQQKKQHKLINLKYGLIEFLHPISRSVTGTI